SANSLAVLAAQFSYGTDIKEVRSTIEQNLASAGLPQGVTPTVNALDINASPIVIASVTAKDGDLQKLDALARSELLPALSGLPGVGSVDLTGGLERRIQVTLAPAKLAAAGVSVQQVVGVLAANNVTIPSGQLPIDSLLVPVSTTNRFSSVDDLRNLVVGARSPSAAPGAAGGGGTPGQGAGGAGASPVPSAAAPTPSAAVPTPSAPAVPVPTPIRLSDIGRVDEVSLPTTGYARTDGQPSVVVSISKSSGANTVDVADEAKAELDSFAAAHSSELSTATVSDLSTFITESRDGLLREGGLGALFAVVVIFLFLFSLRSTLVAAMSIPISIFTALCLMLVGGITINVMTLGGLAVAVGRVVDDAIVVLENIYRHRARGDDRMTAVVIGAREVSGAITASTITTVGVFLPIGFVGGIVSQFFLPFAVTVTFALLASLVVALTIVPVLAYFLVDRVSRNVDETGEPKRSIWIRLYEPTVRLALRNRVTKLGVLAVAVVLFALSVSLVPRIPTQFINAGSEKILSVYLSPPPGTSSKGVLDQATKAESLLRARPEVTLVQLSVPGEGSTGLQTIAASFSGRPANSAQLTVRLQPSVDLKAETKALVAALQPQASGGWAVTVSEQTGVGGSSALSVIVSGTDRASVAKATGSIVDALRSEPDLVNLRSDLSQGAPGVEVRVDPQKAALVGSSTAQIGAEVRSALAGQLATTVDLGGASLPVYVQLEPSAIASVAQLSQLPVGTAARVPLGRVADVSQVDSQGSSTRIDQSPAAAISAEITSPDQGGVSRVVQQRIDALKADGTIPAGVGVRLAGVTEEQNNAFGGLFAAMGVAILLVYVTLVLTFDSLVTPFIIMFSLPLATIGAFPALVLTGRPIGISALIGFLMLIGIVVTNAIVLLDLVERLRGQGEPTSQALVEGGKIRVRPILMTALATMLALIPLASGIFQGSIIAAELGTVVIGGLFSSTFLTLIVIPVVYSLVDGAKASLRVRRRATAAVAGGSLQDAAGRS
ncbi:MAG TPA: efflux RND transporter permease subunit, partial [Candidatus Dormibacteraeota bacterium]|nr:efflux RND transporter permease subunit [Candidatus Dormibacteraeota bacterium]